VVADYVIGLRYRNGHVVHSGHIIALDSQLTGFFKQTHKAVAELDTELKLDKDFKGRDELLRVFEVEEAYLV
jgi:hypothetical protein